MMFSKLGRGQYPSLSEILNNDEDARVCRDIPDEACRVVPANRRRLVLSQLATALAELMVNAKTVLPWLFQAVGAPVWLIGWLVPIRESGSMLPQIILGAHVRRMPLRRRAWLWGAGLQAGCLVLMALVTLLGSGWLAGLLLLLLLTVMSLARGLCSIAAKDVLGKTIPKQGRGRVTGTGASLAGGVGLIFGLVLSRLDDIPPWGYALILLLAALVWLWGMACYRNIEEQPGATEGAVDGWRQAMASLRLVHDDPHFARFLLVRTLLLSTALVTPYYVLLARETDTSMKVLGMLVIAQGLAQFASGWVWGRMADTSSRRVMQLAAVIASLLGLAVWLHLGWLAGTPLPGYFPLVIFVLSLAHAGVRVGRKTYLVDLAGGNRRTDYVSVSNTLMGLLLLLAGALSMLLALLSSLAVILVFSLMGLVGVWLAQGLPEVQVDS
ncbi:MFS transporter [Zobellella endophytica]|uniref:MFS transporter n=1 Tax=Zobellella endophytica TaxID=2116700 RepID=A0A2P7R7X9_9GAMM|nr:MFS transporter [Zobellella endophytica]PSJ46328.1 MFS transporter [Zobellella endophytica]